MRMRAALIVAVLTLSVSGAAAAAGPFADYSGRQLYERFCASCHGPSGYGDGPVAPSLKVLVPDLTRMYQRSGGKFPEDRVRRIIDGRQVYPVHGSRDMPVWGQEFWIEGGGGKQADAQAQVIVDKLVDYLRSIQQ
jgi:mono/diheme cytochrome c family protein